MFTGRRDWVSGLLSRVRYKNFIWGWVPSDCPCVDVVEIITHGSGNLLTKGETRVGCVKIETIDLSFSTIEC